MAQIQRNAKAMQAKGKLMCVTQYGLQTKWSVASPSSSKYIVFQNRKGELICNCRFGQMHWRKGWVCSHIFAVKSHSNNWQHAELTSFWATEEDRSRQHRRGERFQDVHLTVRAAA